MDNFLDTNVILGYALYSSGEDTRINSKCYGIITNKKEGKRIVCFFTLEQELPKVRKKRKAIRLEVLKKFEEADYEIGTSENAIKNLPKGDINKAKRLYQLLKNDPQKITKLMIEEAEFEKRIDYFIRFLIDEKVTPVEEINNKLVMIISGIIWHTGDAKMLTSALMCQKNKATFFFVTKDREHFHPNGYNFLKEDPRLKDLKFPKLRNLFFTD